MPKDSLPAPLIIDMQQGMRDTPAPRNNPDAGPRIAHARCLARRRRAGGACDISRTPGSPFWPGQPSAAFQADFTPLAHEHVQEKNVPDAFIHSGLGAGCGCAASKRW
jgi:hypothetical protein